MSRVFAAFDGPKEGQNPRVQWPRGERVEVRKYRPSVNKIQLGAAADAFRACNLRDGNQRRAAGNIFPIDPMGLGKF
jgi:hypothetical protein